MNRINKSKPITYTALMLVAAAMIFAAQGCGGGGGGTAASPAVRTGSGLGRVAAVVSFQPPASAARAAGVTTATYTVSVDISIEGDYSETGEAFDPVTAHVDVEYPGGHAQASVLNVPIGINHLLVATAAFPGAPTQTLKVIIPQVSENVETTATADERSTAIANAAIALAAQGGIKLSEITPEQLTQVALAVDEIYAAGVPYSEISTESVLNYSTLSTQVASLEITPASATLVPGSTLQFSAIARNSFGVEFTPSTSLQWAASSEIGTISATGLLTAGSLPGAGTVTVTAPGATPVSAMAGVLVDYAIDSATLTPAMQPYAEQTLTQQFTFSGITPGGQTVDLTSLALWAPSSGLTSTGAPGNYTFSQMGTQSLSASYNGVTASITFEVVEPPITGLSFTPPGQLAFEESVTMDFAPIGGRAPFTYEIVGAAPPSLTIDPNTGVVSGYAPTYMSNWQFGVRVTDALGRSTSSADPNNITDAIVNIRMSVADKLNEFKNILQVADGALDNVTNLIITMKSLADQGAAGGADYSALDAQYLSMKDQLDQIANTTSFNGTITTNGPILLNGAYSYGNLQVPLSGGYPISELYTYLPSVLTTDLGVYSTALTDQSYSSDAIFYLDNALGNIAMARNDNGMTSNYADYIIDIDNYIGLNFPTNECYTDLIAAANASNFLYGKVADLLNINRQLVTQAGSGVMSQADVNLIQQQIDMNNGYLNELASASAYYSLILLDGSFSATCPNAPTVSNISIRPYDLGIDYIFVAEMPYTPDSDIALIDAALSSITAQRATLAGNVADIQLMINGGATATGGIMYTGVGGGQLVPRPAARRTAARR